MKLFSVKDLAGEIHTFEADAVEYVRSAASGVEAIFKDAEGKVVAVFRQFHWIKAEKQ